MRERGQTRAVFFDVDFTLIYPGPRFQASGYQDFCARHGIEVDPAAFDRAVAAAASGLDAGDDLYDAQLYVDYTKRIIEGMGGRGAAVEAVAREIYDEWAACCHFTLYDEVPDVLRTLHGSGFKIGLISNSHRCLTSFETHFELRGLFSRCPVFCRARLHETPPQHLRGGSARCGGDRNRVGDGRGQPGARCRRRPAARHAGCSGLEIGTGSGARRRAGDPVTS